jgi:aminobenzoyl-glutamate transport protein
LVRPHGGRQLYLRTCRSQDLDGISGTGERTPLGLARLLFGHPTTIHNFVSFPALGVTLTMVLGLGVAQGTGALEAGVRMAFARVPAKIVPYGVAFLCCQGHMLSDGSYVLLPPLAMQIFKAKGRNPLAGLITGLACVSVGYGGGLIFGTSDVGYTAVTESAAKTMTGVHGYVTGVTMNNRSAG